MNGLTEKGSTIDTLGQWKFLGSNTKTTTINASPDDVKISFNFNNITPSTYPVLLVGVKYISGSATSTGNDTMYIQNSRYGVYISNSYIQSSNITYYGMLRGVTKGYISIGATTYGSVQSGLFVTLPNYDSNITLKNYTLQMNVYGFVPPEF